MPERAGKKGEEFTGDGCWKTLGNTKAMNFAEKKGGRNFRAGKKRGQTGCGRKKKNSGKVKVLASKKGEEKMLT